MTDYLQDGGYFPDLIKNKKSEHGGVTVIRFLTIQNIPFLIAYADNDPGHTDISDLYEASKKPGDEFCSLFVRFSGKEGETYSGNIRTKQYTRLRELIPYHDNKEAACGGFVMESDRFEDVFFAAHSFLRDIDGLHPDEALDELCKIIYAKLYDEETNAGIFNMKYGNAEEYACAIRFLYKQANDSGGRRPRGAFSEPIYLSANALTRVSALFAGYDFSKADIDYKARAFQNIYKPAVRAGMGQYFTPVQVIRLLVNCMRPQKTEAVIDPFAGSACFLTETLRFVADNDKTEKNLSGFISGKLHGIEKSERMARIAMTDMRLHGDGRPNIRCADSLLPFAAYTDLQPESFDIVMTNPPFGSVLRQESCSYLGEYELIKQKRNVPLEVLGLERSVQLLREGGKLGIVLPESIFVNKSYQYVREWLIRHVKIRGIISLPQNTFFPFGANIKTSILIASKGYTPEKYNVFTAIVENIGFDRKGDDVEGADWQETAESFTAFIEKEGW